MLTNDKQTVLIYMKNKEAKQVSLELVGKEKT